MAAIWIGPQPIGTCSNLSGWGQCTVRFKFLLVHLTCIARSYRQLLVQKVDTTIAGCQYSLIQDSLSARENIYKSEKSACVRIEYVVYTQPSFFKKEKSALTSCNLLMRRTFPMPRRRALVLIAAISLPCIGVAVGTAPHFDAATQEVVDVELAFTHMFNQELKKILKPNEPPAAKSVKPRACQGQPSAGSRAVFASFHKAGVYASGQLAGLFDGEVVPGFIYSAPRKSPRAHSLHLWVHWHLHSTT